MTATWTDPATGCRLAYDDVGRGPPVVLIHAFPLCREMWAGQRAALAATHRVLTPDVFGFGQSELPAGGWTVDGLADALAGWLAGIGVTGPVAFGGLSMGGYVALAFARRHPGRVKGLILADTRAEADSAEAKAGRDASIEFVRRSGVAAQVEKMLPNLLGPFTQGHLPHVADEVRRIGAAQSVDGVTAALAALRDRPDSMADLDGFRFPALVVVGGEDRVTPPAAATAMAEKLRDVTTEVLPGAGHLANLEAPAAFNSALTRWLAAIA
jgi:pimeloyl-ACP methyl ester carboxylesterase